MYVTWSFMYSEGNSIMKFKAWQKFLPYMTEVVGLSPIFSYSKMDDVNVFAFSFLPYIVLMICLQQNLIWCRQFWVSSDHCCLFFLNNLVQIERWTRPFKIFCVVLFKVSQPAVHVQSMVRLHGCILNN
jgi:hypothetical protein